MKPHNYQEVAKALAVNTCQGCSRYTERQHRLGVAETRSGTIHWHERHVTKPGLRNFLKLYAYIKLAHQRPGIPAWKKLWEENALAYRVALKEFHTLIPARLSHEDREAAMADIWRRAVRLESTNVPRSAWAWMQEN